MPTKTRSIVTDFPEGVFAESHRIASLIEVIDPATDDVILEVETGIEGTISYDARAAARATLDLTVHDDGTGELLPTDSDSPLAPLGNELRISSGIETSDEILLRRMGIFRIDRPTIDANAEIKISGIDRASRYMDASFLNPYNVASGTDAVEALEAVLEAVWGVVEFDIDEAEYPLPALLADAFDDRWAFAQGLATVMAQELYHDDNGIVVGRTIVSPTEANSRGVFSEGEGGVLLGVERDWDREPLFNHWTAIGTSPGSEDDGDIREVAVDDNPNSPTYFYGNFGQKPNSYESTWIKDSTGAQNVANSLLARSQGAPDVINFDVAPDPTYRPGDVVQIVREELGLEEYHVLDQITIPLSAAGSMTGQTRALIELAGG